MILDTGAFISEEMLPDLQYMHKFIRIKYRQIWYHIPLIVTSTVYIELIQNKVILQPNE